MDKWADGNWTVHRMDRQTDRQTDRYLSTGSRHCTLLPPPPSSSSSSILSSLYTALPFLNPFFRLFPCPGPELSPHRHITFIEFIFSYMFSFYFVLGRPRTRRYALLLGEFINHVTWTETEDFRRFCRIVYPFLGLLGSGEVAKLIASRLSKAKKYPK